MEHGKIAVCPASFVIDKFNKHFDMKIGDGGEDLLDIHSFEKTGWDMNRHLHRPSNMCKWCNRAKLQFAGWESCNGNLCSKEDWLNTND